MPVSGCSQFTTTGALRWHCVPVRSNAPECLAEMRALVADTTLQRRCLSRRPCWPYCSAALMVLQQPAACSDRVGTLYREEPGRAQTCAGLRMGVCCAGLSLVPSRHQGGRGPVCRLLLWRKSTGSDLAGQAVSLRVRSECAQSALRVRSECATRSAWTPTAS